MKNIKEIIAENLIALRKKNNFTQNELAQKLNYSDNTISRWERGEVTPSIECLEQISQVYNVPLQSMLEENILKSQSIDRKAFLKKKLATALLCVSLVWFICVIAFFYFQSFLDINLWTIFIWCIPASCIIMLFYARYLKTKIFAFIMLTIFILTFILGFYLQFLKYNLYLIFFIGVPAQLALSVSIFMRGKNKKPKNIKGN